MQVCRFGPASAGIIKHDMLSSPADKTIKILFVVRRELFYFIGNEVSYEIKNSPLWIALRRNGRCRLRGPPQAENPAKQDSFLLLYKIHTPGAVMTTPWAIPGTLFPSLKLMGDSSAPVGTNRTFFHSPKASFGKIQDDSTTALQAHPLPPEWVS